ncbi:signal peptidase I [Xylanimonas allomyrinae]|uniref:signal peptidase I n=1 Tax=Xylanimonas allomyrinae TaxID=2509459 RepID=UPI0013A65E3B|nr:signal peptidase I [Xylanimonas allomyrinae]
MSGARRARSITTALLTVLLLGLTVLVALVSGIPRVLGAVPLTVLSGSMEPALAPGDLVVVRPTPADRLQIGDVVTFQPVSADPTLVTHRVTGLTLGRDGVHGLTTQGDANSAPDEPIVADQVMGKVLYSVPWVGRLTGAEWAPHATTVAGIALLGYGLRTVVLAHRSGRRPRAHGGVEP